MSSENETENVKLQSGSDKVVNNKQRDLSVIK